MLKILPVILILILISGGLIWWRFSASKTLDEPISAEVEEEVDSVEVPKTLPDAPIEDKVKTLEESVDTLVSEINSLKKTSSSESNGSLDARLKSVEGSVTELKVKVSALEQATPAPVQTTTTTNPPLYIPLGSGGSTQSQAFVNIDTYQIALNPQDYAGYKNMQLEVNIRRNQPGNQVYARLYNTTDGTVTSSEMTTSSTTFVWLSSNGFTLASGAKTYVVQLKVPDGTEGFIQNARIKINF